MTIRLKITRLTSEVTVTRNASATSSTSGAPISGPSQVPAPPIQTRAAGLFVFWPLLAQLGFGELVEQAGYPGSGMVPATSALLSLLALKLIDKERRSHISDLDFDEALGLFAGLNIPPKVTFATDSS